MGEPERLRDSTQIVLPTEDLDHLSVNLEDEFTVSVNETDGEVHIVGSPVVIKEVAGFLARNGVNIP